MRRPEQALQRSVLHTLQTLYGAAFAFHVPNGGGRSKVEASILKGLGVVAGVPDIVVVRPCGRVAWLELKAPKGRISGSQLAVHAMLAERGHMVHTVTDCTQLLSLLMAWKAEDRCPLNVQPSIIPPPAGG